MSKETVFKDSNGTVIKIGDMIKVISIDESYKLYKIMDLDICHNGSRVFSIPELLTAIDFQDCYIINK